MDKEFLDSFNELLDSKNQQIEELSDEDNLDAVKDKYQKLSEKFKDFSGKNRQVFERFKKVEEEMKELKAKADDSDKKSKTKSEKSDEELLKRLDNMALKFAKITDVDEVELYQKWKDQTGREADSIIENKIFQAELTDLRTGKANAAATANIKGEAGISGEKGNPDYWIARATKGPDGELMFPEDMPKDFKLHAAIVEKMVASTKSAKEFYNQ